jgi:amino acid transporter
MAEQNELPKFVGAVHEKFKTPYISLLITAGAILILTIQSSFISALTISTITRLLVYATTCAALPVLRRRKYLAAAQFRAPFGNVFAIGSLLLIVWLLANVDYAKEGLVFLAAIAVGFVIYFLGIARNKIKKSA